MLVVLLLVLVGAPACPKKKEPAAKKSPSPTPAGTVRVAFTAVGVQASDAAVNDAVRAAGVDVVRRRSGGGAVLLDPGDCWIDLVLPRSDPLWVVDVGRAAGWVGDAWAGALRDLGLDGMPHRGPMVRSRWSGLVCFAGLAIGVVAAASLVLSRTTDVISLLLFVTVGLILMVVGGHLSAPIQLAALGGLTVFAAAVLIRRPGAITATDLAQGLSFGLPAAVLNHGEKAAEGGDQEHQKNAQPRSHAGPHRPANPSQPILEAIEAWSEGPPPVLPDGPPGTESPDGDVELARRTLREASHPAPLKRAIAVVARAGSVRISSRSRRGRRCGARSSSRAGPTGCCRSGPWW